MTKAGNDPSLEFVALVYLLLFEVELTGTFLFWRLGKIASIIARILCQSTVASSRVRQLGVFDGTPALPPKPDLSYYLND